MYIHVHVYVYAHIYPCIRFLISVKNQALTAWLTD
jgi:hypothetical protein